MKLQVVAAAALALAAVAPAQANEALAKKHARGLFARKDDNFKALLIADLGIER